MSPGGLLRLLVPALIITLASGVSTAPPATTSDSASDPNVLTNQPIIEMAATKLPKEIIITKTFKTNFGLLTSALVELNTGGVSANVDARVTRLCV
jgi:hypothetical protein